MREIPLEEVVIIIRGTNQGEESAVTLHNLPRTVSPRKHNVTLPGDRFRVRRQNTFPLKQVHASNYLMSRIIKMSLR